MEESSEAEAELKRYRSAEEGRKDGDGGEGDAVRVWWRETGKQVKQDMWNIICEVALLNKCSDILSGSHGLLNNLCIRKWLS